MGIWWCKNLRFVSWFSRWACRFSRWACRFLHNILFHILPIFVWLPDSRITQTLKLTNRPWKWAGTQRKTKKSLPTTGFYERKPLVSGRFKLQLQQFQLLKLLEASPLLWSCLLLFNLAGSTPQKKRSFSAQDSGKTRMTTLDSQTSAPWFITIPDITLKRTWWRWNWWDVHTQLGYEWFVIYLPPCGPPNTGLYLLDLLPDESETCNQWQSNISWKLGGGFSPTHLKNVIVKLDHFPKVRAEN